MRKTFAAVFVAAAMSAAADFPIDIPSIPDVRVTDSFWGARMETNRLVTVPAALDRYEKAGRLDNFRNAAARRIGVKYNGSTFEDSDLYRILEGAFLACLAHPDPKLQARAEAIVPIIAAAQEPDGYLYTAHTLNCVGKERDRAGPTRWSNLQDSHEFYCMGQLVEAALAHKQLTGKDDLMNVMWRNVDLVARTFGNGRSQLRRVPGHEEPEIALPKLWRFSHEPATLELLRNFIDWRGRADLRPLYGTPGDTFDAAYYQDAMPVREQRKAMGHAVRACYLYAGMAETIALTGDKTLRPALDAIWEDVVARKMYVTGGVGACHAGEKFGADFELPNEKGYLETCAALANMLWQFRMFRLDGDAKYMDVFERILYNNFASGVSIGGDSFFYMNPLASRGGVTRWRWHGCPCCPANVVRIIPQIGTYVYASSKNALYWNLFLASDATIRLANGGKVKVRQTNNGYPWRGDGLVLSLDPGAPRRFDVKVRIPGWARGRCVPSGLYAQVNPASQGEVSLAVNGKPVALAVERGYATISRTWKPGDRIELSLGTVPRLVRADARVAADVGRLAVERGPVVYCAEGVDNGGRVLDKCIDEAGFRDGAGVRESSVDICGLALPAICVPAVSRTQSEGAAADSPATLTLVPYFAWSHRGAGEMQTWISAARGPYPVAD